VGFFFKSKKGEIMLRKRKHIGTIEDIAKEEKQHEKVPGNESETHPVGVATGGSAGAAAGAAIGSVMGGPAGAAFGGAVGAVAGGLAGKSLAEAFYPDEENYWKENFESRPYSHGRQYEEFDTAYRYGWELAKKEENSKKDFEEVESESELEESWPSYRSSESDTWQDFREAVRDAYNRVRDGKEGK
jgi:hypothetical protein